MGVLEEHARGGGEKKRRNGAEERSRGSSRLKVMMVWK